MASGEGLGTPTARRAQSRLLLARRSMMTVVARASGAFLTAFLTVYVARTQGVEASGDFFVLVSSMTAMSVVTRLGSDAYLSRLIAGQRLTHRQAIARAVFATYLACALLILVLGVALTIFRYAYPDASAGLLRGVNPALWTAAVLGLNGMWIAGAYARARGQAATSVFLETALFSLWLLTTLVIQDVSGIALSSGNIIFATALLVPALAPLGLILILRSNDPRPRRSDLLAAMSGIVRFGAVTVMNGAIAVIPLQTLGALDLESEAGVFNAALRVSMVIGAFGVVVRSLVVQAHYRGRDVQRSRREDLVSAAKSTAPWIVVSILLGTQADVLVRIFGSDFADLGGILTLMLVTQCVFVGGNMIEAKAILANEIHILNIVSAVTVVVALLATPALVYFFGLPGAVGAFVIIVTTNRVLLAVLYLRSSPDRSQRTPAVA